MPFSKISWLKLKQNLVNLWSVVKIWLLPVVLIVLVFIVFKPLNFFEKKFEILPRPFVTKTIIAAKPNQQSQFDQWSLQKTGKLLIPTQDDDNDGLTNEEEFKLDTNPLSPNTCSPDKTDGENLLNLIDPATCQKINLDDPIQQAKFAPLFQYSNIQQKLATDINSAQNLAVTQDSSSILQLFGVQNYSDLENYDQSKIDNEYQLVIQKKQDLSTIEKIKNYIAKFRSFEPYDRDYDLPVSPVKYLEVSQNYNVPLKYVLAVAQLESRFGTDRFDAMGNLNRIGKYKNIYALGLASNQSQGFDTWEDGVDAFGKWYQYFQDKGVSDCQKWRIYNQNGDYCTSVEQKANSIDKYLDS
jgi:hypothetical protein